MSASSLKQLVYVSSAVAPYSTDELVDILRVSRRNNEAVGVTGALLHSGGNIMQVLEGPGEAVDAVYARVCADRRHHSAITLLDRSVDGRVFPDWSMGFVNPDVLSDEDREAARSLRSLTESGPDAAQRLMGSFRHLLPGRPLGIL
ncbi:MAG: BLUF domain-containing protein [Rubricoccaceae bacterium]